MIGPDDLEQQCIEPGLWLIEGVQVRRPGSPRRRWLIVWTPANGDPPEMVDTLAAARVAIADAANAGRLDRHPPDVPSPA